MLFIHFDRWKKKFPHVDGTKGRQTIEATVISNLELCRPGVRVNLWRSIEIDLERAELMARYPFTKEECDAIDAVFIRHGQTPPKRYTA